MQTEVFGIPGPIFFDLKTFSDERGSFRELYNVYRYEEWLPIGIQWKQINHSNSVWNTIRGLHFRHEEAKLVTVISGAIIDVAVDIRKSSRTFGNWMSVRLGPGQQFFIPDGFAHGFEVVSPSGADVVYMTTQIYDASKAKAIAWDDKDLKIKWQTETPILSEQDKKNKSFEEFTNE